eukprot:COSAG03_NODE_671_length_6365_cov_25.745292_3_plen_62_part_00
MVVALALTLDARQSSEGQGRIVRMKNHFVPAGPLVAVRYPRQTSQQRALAASRLALGKGAR